MVIIFLCIATPMYLIIGALFFGEPGKTETIILNTEKCGIVFTTRCDISHATCKIFPAFMNSGGGIMGKPYITEIKNVGKEQVKIAFFDRQFNEGDPISITLSSWSHTSLSTLMLSPGESLVLDNVSVPQPGDDTESLMYVLQHSNDPYASIYRKGTVTDILLEEFLKKLY